MKQIERKRRALITRRTALLLGGQGLLLGALGSRLFHLQVSESSKYIRQASDNSFNLRIFAPRRGLLVDRFGRVLIDNDQRFSLQIIPENTQDMDVEETLAELAKHIDLGQDKINAILKRDRQQPSFVPLIVKESLSWQDVATISLLTYKLDGVSIEEENSRFYPFAHFAAPVSGYVGKVSTKDQTDEPLLKLPDIRIGKQGVELQYENELRGKAGIITQEINALGRVMKKQITKPETIGKRLQVEIDLDLQQAAYLAIKPYGSGAAVVMDVQNGGVRALVSCPSYNPNLFVDGIGTKNWNDYLEDELNPLSNKAVSGQYSPGSTFKIITLLAALKKGIPIEQKHFCSGALDYGGHTFHCWSKDGHGMVNGIEAMRESCDIWFYNIGQEIGIQAIADMARLFGLGSKTNIDLPGEKSGLVPDPAWKRESRKQSWLGGETLINAIGQGFVLTTPLQLAVMMARLANQGKPVIPRVYLGEGAGGGEEWDEGNRGIERTIYSYLQSNISEEILDKSHVATIMETLNQVTNHPRGTAYQAVYSKDQPIVIGKTGTSQVRRISMSEREAGIRKGEDIARKLRDHALFVGLAPDINPRFAVAVVVEHGGSGSGVAAPIAGRLLRQALLADKAPLLPNDPIIKAIRDAEPNYPLRKQKL